MYSFSQTRNGYGFTVISLESSKSRTESKEISPTIKHRMLKVKNTKKQNISPKPPPVIFTMF